MIEPWDLHTRKYGPSAGLRVPKLRSEHCPRLVVEPSASGATDRQHLAIRENGGVHLSTRILHGAGGLPSRPRCLGRSFQRF